MTHYEIVEARLQHCGQMVRLMRREQREAIGRAGYDPHRELRARFDKSAIRRALLIDGHLAALGGVMGTLLAPHGFVWLVLSEEACRHPLALVRIARRELACVMATYRELATIVLADDAAARRFAIFLGFHVAEDEYGNPSQIPIGRARATVMGFHEGSH